MGRYHPLLFLVLTALFAASCGDREEAAHFSWSPERPEAENRLTIRYNPAAPEASLGGSEDLLLRVNLIGEEGGVRAEEIPMEREGGVFAASFTPEDLLDRPVLLVAAVLDADVPEAVDNNRDDPWMIPLYHEGKAAEGAHYRISRLLTGDSRFKEPLRVDPDFDEAREQIERELELHPENRRAEAGLWEISLRLARRDPARLDSLHREIRPKVTSYFNKISSWKTRPEEATAMLSLLPLLEEEALHDSLTAALLDRFPEDEKLLRYAYEDLLDGRDLPGTAEDLARFVREHPESGPWEEARGNLVWLYSAHLGSPEKAAEIMADGGPVEAGDVAIYADWLAEEKEDAKGAIATFKRVIEEEKEEEWPGEGPLSEREWELNRRSLLAHCHDRLAALSEEEGLAEEAAGHLAVIAAEMQEEATAGRLARLARLQTKTGREEEALATYDLLAARAEPSEETVEEWRSLFAEHHPEDDFEAHVEGLREKARARAMEELSRMALRLPAPDISFEGPEGETHSISDFEGKVVLVDFWATWCGPCLRALPIVEEVALDYESDGGMVFLPINVWEQSEGEERRAEVMAQWEELGLTSTVYFDPDPAEGVPSATDRYHVKGIPTSFVIGKTGEILFKTVGFGGEGSEEELRSKLEFALAR